MLYIPCELEWGQSPEEFSEITNGRRFMEAYFWLKALFESEKENISSCSTIMFFWLFDDEEVFEIEPVKNDNSCIAQIPTLYGRYF